MIWQLFLGSLVLFVCSFLGLAVLLFTISRLRSLHARHDESGFKLHMVVIPSLIFITIIGVHTLQVWVWAVSLYIFGALPTMIDSVYFAVSTYTTVGYGDIILSPDMRLFGSMASVNGMVSFGISTAFLVSIMSKIFPDHLS